MPAKSGLERRCAMNGHRQAHGTAGFAVDVMAAVDSKQLPAAPLGEPSKLSARNNSQSAISTTRALSSRTGDSISADK